MDHPRSPRGFPNRPGLSTSFRPRCPGLLIFLLLLTLISTSGLAAAPGAGEQAAQITVDAGTALTTLNPLLFGQNILFAGNGLYNPQTSGLDPAGVALVKKLAPTILRFPGGGVADFYFWEDGLGYRTTEAANPRSPSLALDGTPPWELVSQARIRDQAAKLWSEPFTMMVSGNRLLGVIGLKGSYAAGSLVRLERRPGQPDWFTHTYGILEFLKTAETLGAKALITVNYGTGLTKEGRVSTEVSLSQKVKRAAALVALANGSPGDTRSLGVDGEGHDWRTVGYWAGLRAAQGHPEPFRVLYWEVGNEVYDKSEAGFTSAAKYGGDLPAFAKEMQAVDPSVKLGAVGITIPRGKGDADARDEWNPTVMKLAGDRLDFFILHPYYPGGGDDKSIYKGRAWFTAVMAASGQALADLREIRAMVNAATPSGRQVGLALTEYGIWPFASQDARDYSNLARALYEADLLLSLVREGADLGVILATAWNLHGNNQTAAIGFNWSTGKRTLRPQFYAQELLVKYLQPRILETGVTAPAFAASQVFNVKARSGIPLLKALASLSPDRKRLSLIVVNRSLTADVRTAIHLKGFSPKARAAVVTLGGTKAGDHNEDATPAVTPMAGALDYAAPQFPYTFKSHSLTVLEFQSQP